MRNLWAAAIGAIAARQAGTKEANARVVYRLRRPWPNEHGATHLILDPLDFLRRLAALVLFPYSHQVRSHGVFARRSRMRRLLPPPPQRQEVLAIEAGPPLALQVAGSTDAKAPAQVPQEAR